MPTYRPANPAPALWHVVKTLPMLGGFWLLTLILVPLGIVRLQEAAHLDHFFFATLPAAGSIVIVVGTALVTWSVITFAAVGGGTPLPFDSPRRLVVTGPYAWTRNPMATGFVIQGIGVGLLAGTAIVIVVFVLFGIWWNLGVRPLGEDLLQKAFGRDFELYRRHVPCWVPRAKRWSPPPPTAPISLEELPIPGRARRES